MAIGENVHNAIDLVPTSSACLPRPSHTHGAAESAVKFAANIIHAFYAPLSNLAEYATYMVLIKQCERRNLISSPFFFRLQASPAPYAKAL